MLKKIVVIYFLFGGEPREGSINIGMRHSQDPKLERHWDVEPTDNTFAQASKGVRRCKERWDISKHKLISPPSQLQLFGGKLHGVKFRLMRRCRSLTVR